MFTVKQVVNSVDGWLFEGEAGLLNTLASEVRSPNVVAEIGSYRGRSTICLALNSFVPVYAIDPRLSWIEEPFQFGMQDQVVFLKNILDYGVADIVHPIALKSWDISFCFPHPIGLLFIDGNHVFDNVVRDLTAYIPKMAEGGLIAMHDANLPDVARAIATIPNLALIESVDITEVYRVMV